MAEASTSASLLQSLLPGQLLNTLPVDTAIPDVNTLNNLLMFNALQQAILMKANHLTATPVIPTLLKQDEPCTSTARETKEVFEQPSNSTKDCTLLKAALESNTQRTAETSQSNHKKDCDTPKATQASVTNALKRRITSQQQQQLSAVLTAPKLSRHNDAAYYPNIQCVLCEEWVCSRNRYMHIESHLQYRPYSCSACGYDNRKEIFIQLHIKKVHAGSGEVVYQPDSELEHRAWTLAEQCLQHTRDILMKSGDDESSPKEQRSSKDTEDSQSPSVSTVDNAENETDCKRPKVDMSLLQPYSDVYRPRIHNSQRIEKSELIEESRQAGLVPDFTEIKQREVQCQLCKAHVLGHQSLVEEHVRQHLSRATYRCGIDNCTTEHASKNFLTRHMKEVHKYRRPPVDLLDADSTLRQEYRSKCAESFPELYVKLVNGQRCRSSKAKQQMEPKTAASTPSAPVTLNNHTTLKQQLSAPSLDMRRAVTPPAVQTPLLPTTSLASLLAQFNAYGTVTANNDNNATSQLSQLLLSQNSALSDNSVQCSLCNAWLNREHTALYAHVRTHLQANQLHSDSSNSTDNTLLSSLPYAHQCNILLIACFPSVPLQPIL